MPVLWLYLVAAPEKGMSLFRKKAVTPPPVYPAERFEPVIRSSICTGEKTACMRDMETGKLHEVSLIRSDHDLDEFCRTYGVNRDRIRTIY